MNLIRPARCTSPRAARPRGALQAGLLVGTILAGTWLLALASGGSLLAHAVVAV